MTFPWFNHAAPLPIEDDDDELDAPPFGVHPQLDQMAMLYYVIRQQHDIYRAMYQQAIRYRRLSLLWCLMAVLWMVLMTFQAWHLLPLWH